MVNYSPKLESVISDAETERREETTSMYYLHYFVSGSDNELVVATTRPETLFGDVAIMVHPKDKRFKKMIGRNAIIPIINREIPIIADDSVDREFGTGAVKVTPAHDPTDFAVAKRHKLPLDRIVIDKNGYMTPEAGMFVGQEAEVARENVVELLKARGNLIKIEPHIQQVSYCIKGNCRIQSIISTQWFVDSQKMAEPVMKGFHAGEFDIIPSRYSKIFEDWMENLHDWCISRQLWW
jgi:valyl-tRNA synthetase